MDNMQIDKEKAIRAIVASNVQTFAQTFSQRHITEIDNPYGTINMKIHNVFIAVLGKEIQYYTALVRSLDSSLGNMLEAMALSIAGLTYDVEKSVKGYLYPSQVNEIGRLLEAYKNSNNPLTPSVLHYKLIDKAGEHYQQLKDIEKDEYSKSHVSDYYFYDDSNNKHYILELKIGGDLDNKKARSEKEAIFEQYAILKNKLGNEADITCYFATAYNRFGEGNSWEQGRVKQFFSTEELLIGRDFWNFVCKSSKGYDIVIDEYTKNSKLILSALNSVKECYLGAESD